MMSRQDLNALRADIEDAERGGSRRARYPVTKEVLFDLIDVALNYDACIRRHPLPWTLDPIRGMFDAHQHSITEAEAVEFVNALGRW